MISYGGFLIGLFIVAWLTSVCEGKKHVACEKE